MRMICCSAWQLSKLQILLCFNISTGLNYRLFVILVTTALHRSCGLLRGMARLALVGDDIDSHRLGQGTDINLIAKVMKCNDDIITYQLFSFVSDLEV